MPFYCVPFNMYERARIAALKISHPSKADEILLELVQTHASDEIPLFAGSWVHLNFGSRRNKTAPPPCCTCGWISTRLCDWIVEHSVYKEGKPLTCDRPLCEYCSTSPAPNKDICPLHVGPLKAWLAARTNTTDGDGP